MQIFARAFLTKSNFGEFANVNTCVESNALSCYNKCHFSRMSMNVKSALNSLHLPPCLSYYLHSLVLLANWKISWQLLCCNSCRNLGEEILAKRKTRAWANVVGFRKCIFICSWGL